MKKTSAIFLSATAVLLFLSVAYGESTDKQAMIEHRRRTIRSPEFRQAAEDLREAREARAEAEERIPRVEEIDRRIESLRREMRALMQERMAVIDAHREQFEAVDADIERKRAVVRAMLRPEGIAKTSEEIQPE